MLRKKRKIKGRISAKEILDSLNIPGGKSWFAGKEDFDTNLAIETIDRCIEKLNLEEISSSWQRRSTCVTSFFFYLQEYNAHGAYHALYEIIEGFNRDITEELSQESIAFYKGLLQIYNNTFEKKKTIDFGEKFYENAMPLVLKSIKSGEKPFLSTETTMRILKDMQMNGIISQEEYEKHIHLWRMKDTICTMKKEDWLKLDQDLEYYDKNQIKYDLTKLPVLKSIMRDLCLNLENIKKIPDFILNGDQFQCLLKQIKELNELLYSLSDKSL